MIEFKIRVKENLEYLPTEDCEWYVINHNGCIEEYGISSGRVADWLEVVVFKDGVELGTL